MTRARVTVLVNSLLPGRPRALQLHAAAARVRAALQRSGFWPFLWLAILYLCALCAIRSSHF
jgi:hypothetical protein